MIDRETMITVGAIAASWALAQLLVWIRARRAHRAEQQLRTDMQMRRGFRTLQRRGWAPKDLL